MRLIDALELENLIVKQAGDCKIRLFDPSVNLILQDIRNASTIEAASVKHGYWKEKPSYAEDKALGFDFQIVCSECDLQNSYFVFGEDYEPEEKTFIRSRYCPNCGAKMDGGEPR